MKRISDYTVLGIQVVLGYVFLHFAGPLTENVFIRIVSACCITLSVTISLKSLYDLRKSFAVAPTPTKDSELVTNGVYSVIRHPMYASIILASTGYLLLRASLSMLPPYVAIVLFFAAKINYEERKLVGKFAGYPEYKKVTGAIFPRIRLK
jgi:protein-S-isoprenylcysteine O-methyltransferase Ste14